MKAAITIAWSDGTMHVGVIEDPAKVEVLRMLLAPAEAQGGGEVVAEVYDAADDVPMSAPTGAEWAAKGQTKVRQLRPLPIGTKLYTAPPSAPVGVEGLVAKWKKESESLDIHPAGLAARRVCAIELEHALAQKPAAYPDRIVLWSRGVSPHWYFVAKKANRPDMVEGPVYETLDEIVLRDSPEAQQPAAVDREGQSRYMQKLWLEEWLSDHDITLASDAYAELLDALARRSVSP